jgi:predicted RNA-binding Zn-ribbon protein involved in translation (DUF1610 family)
MMFGVKRCPACGAEVRPEAVRLGLGRRYPPRCRACGVKLAYDTAGGIYAVPKAKQRSD